MSTIINDIFGSEILLIFIILFKFWIIWLENVILVQWNWRRLKIIACQRNFSKHTWAGEVSQILVVHLLFPVIYSNPVTKHYSVTFTFKLEIWHHLPVQFVDMTCLLACPWRKGLHENFTLYFKIIVLFILNTIKVQH